jgi:hypothetical protein
MNPSRKYDMEIAALFVQSYGEALRAARNILVSIRRTDELFPLSATALQQLDDESLERLDAFRVRYAQFQDVLANKLFRGLLRLEEEATGSMLDILNAMEKREIIASFDDWKLLRELRNTFMHDYPDQVGLRAEALTRAHAMALELCQVLIRIREFAINRVGLPVDDLPEVPR